MKLTVCLTGGIASGKTYVSNKFAEKGEAVIDTDVLARQVVVKGSEGLAQLVKALGTGILDKQGEMNRSVVKRLVFQDEQKLAVLNAITHPLIRKACFEQSKLVSRGVELWVIPLYDGGAEYPDFDRVLVVDVNPEIQLDRIQSRDEVNLKLAESILAAQPKRQDRFRFATDVINNSGTYRTLNQNIDHIYGLYSQLLAAKISLNKVMQM